MCITIRALDRAAFRPAFDHVLEMMAGAFRTAYQKFDLQRDLRIANLEDFLSAFKQHELEEAESRPDQIDVLVAEIDGELAGAIILDRAEESVLYIRQIATDPRFVRRDVATKLVLESFKRRGDRKIRLVTRRINEASQGLFGSLGFVVDEQWRHPEYDPTVYLAMAEA